jgi:eukaryotic-like serine/threonine-protein kinase
MAPPGPPPPPEEPPPGRELWPWLVVLLVLALAGIAAAWYATRDTGTAKPRTVQTTVAAAPAKPKAKPKKQQTTPAVAQVVVPDLVGQQKEDAARTLDAQGLSASVTEVPSTQEKGIVVAQDPRGGTKVDKGSSVTLNVSKGPNKPQPVAVTVPDVVGESVDSASAAIKTAGLHPSEQHVPSTQEKDTVVSQSPSGGTSAQKGAGVLLNVSTGPEQTKSKPEKHEQANDHHQQPQQPATAAVPSVVGEDATTASGDLQSAGFTVSRVDQPTNDQSQDGMVVDQTPPAGTHAPANSTVTIYVGRYSGG